MRKASMPILGIIVQLILVLMLSATLFGFGVNVIDGEDFAQQVHALDAALVAEVLMSTEDGRANIYAFYENSYSLILEETRASISTPGEYTGRSANFLRPYKAVITEQRATGQVIEWTWFDNQLSINPLRLTQQCPSLAGARKWSSAAAVGEAGLAQRIIEEAYRNRGLNDNTRHYTNKNQVRNEEFFLEIQASEGLSLHAGSGDYNARLRCLANKHLPGIDVSLTPDSRDGATITATNPREHEQAIIDLLVEAAS